jgi:hypothetical protein
MKRKNSKPPEALWKCRVGGRRWKTLVSRYGSPKLDIAFPTAPPTLGNRQRRDFHIPTAPAAVFLISITNTKASTTSFSRSGRRIHQRRFLSFLAFSFQDHLVLESKRSFSIILRLENAKG